MSSLPRAPSHVSFTLLLGLSFGCSGGGGSASPGSTGGPQLAGAAPSVFVGVNPSTGASVARSGFSLKGPTLFHDIAFDPGSGLLFAVDSDTDQLITIDPSTGAGKTWNDLCSRPLV